MFDPRIGCARVARRPNHKVFAAQQDALHSLYPSSTTSASPLIAGSKLLTADDDMPGDAAQRDQEEVVLEQGWEERGDLKIDEATDKALIEYMMGFDVQLTMPKTVYSGKKEGQVFVVTHYEINRRDQMTAHIRFTADPDQDIRMGVSEGDPNLRGLIKQIAPAATHLKHFCKCDEGKSRAMAILEQARRATARMANKISEGDKLRRVEQAGMAFSAMRGTEYAEAICGEAGADIALLAAAPRHYGDARKRDDLQKWKIAECVELKNCFDNGTFRVCDESEVPDGVKVMNCVFSYKAKTTVSSTESSAPSSACICAA